MNVFTTKNRALLSLRCITILTSATACLSLNRLSALDMKYQIDLEKYKGWPPEDINLLKAVLESDEKHGKKALNAFHEAVVRGLVQLVKRGEIIYRVDAKGRYYFTAPSTPPDKI